MTDLEKKAREYGNSAFERAFSDRGIPWNGVRDIFTETFLAGAAYALANQWRDAEKEKPEDGQMILFLAKIRENTLLGEYQHLYCAVKYRADVGFTLWEQNMKNWDGKVLAWLPIPDYQPKGERLWAKKTN